MEWLDYLQWPGMVFTVTGAWLAGSQTQVKRMIGFWTFLIGNIIWITWGFHDNAWALIILQVFLIITNIRGAKKNTSDESKRELKGMVE